MLIHRSSLYYIREFGDLIGLNTGLFLSFCLAQSEVQINKEHFFLFFFATVLWVFSSRSLKVYDDFRSRNFTYELIPFLKAVIVQTVGLIVILFLLKFSVPRSMIFYFIVSSAVAGSLIKLFMRWVLDKYRSKGRNRRNLLIIGAGKVGKKFYDIVDNNPHYGYNIIGFLDDKRPDSMNGEYIGPIDELDRLLSELVIENVIVALPNYAYGKIEAIIATCEKFTTRVKIIPDYSKYSSGKFNVSMFGSIPILSLRNDNINEFHWRLLKRVFDIVFSTIVLLLVLSWAVPVIGLLIKITSPGPIFFKQERWGRDNRKFYAFKFRSMVSNSKDTDSKGKYQQATKDDPRITKVGCFLRKTNLDELPQFLNVLLGNMSVIGPRPHPTPLNIESKKDIKYYMLRHLVKPGITGWAQVNGYRGETKEKKLMQKRVEYDIWYIENWSLWLDLQIVILTAWQMLKGDPKAY